MSLSNYPKKILLLLSLYLTLGSGQISELEMAKIKVYCNEDVPHGQPTPIVITMEMLPVKNSITLHLSTPSYLLAYLEVGSQVQREMPPKFEKTPSISANLFTLGIKTKMKLEYENGYLANFTAIFFSITDKLLTLIGRVPSLPWIYDVTESIRINVNPTEPCVPQVTVEKCSNPMKPKSVLIARNFIIKTKFLDTCNLPIKSVFYWRLTDAIGLSELFSGDEFPLITFYYRSYPQHSSRPIPQVIPCSPLKNIRCDSPPPMRCGGTSLS